MVGMFVEVVNWQEVNRNNSMETKTRKQIVKTEKFKKHYKDLCKKYGKENQLGKEQCYELAVDLCVEEFESKKSKN